MDSKKSFWKLLKLFLCQLLIEWSERVNSIAGKSVQKERNMSRSNACIEIRVSFLNQVYLHKTVYKICIDELL